MPTLAQLKKAAIFAKQNGDEDRALKFHAAVQHETERRTKDPVYSAEGMQMSNPDVPGYVSDDVPWIKPAGPEEGMLSQVGDVVGGIAEVPVTMATGIAGQAVGLGNMIHEGVKAYFAGSQDGRGAAAVDDYFRSEGGRQANEAFSAGAEAATYQPRTEFAQGALETLGEATKSLPPVLGPSLAQAGMAGQAVRGVAPMVAAQAERGAIATVRGARKTGQVLADTSTKLRERIEKSSKPEAFGQGSAGSAEVDIAKGRQAKAGELDDPIDLTLGEATRDPDAIKFERHTQKTSDGLPFREAANVKNKKVANNLDLWIDETGSELVAIGDKGRFLDDTLKGIINRKNEEIGEAYRRAEDAGHMEAPVQLQSMIEYLNEPITRAQAINDGVLKTTRKVLLETGAATEVDGSLVPSPVSLLEGEQIRRSIGENVTIQRSDRRQGRLLKGAYDQDTKDLGGGLYKRARYLRRRFSEEFEDNELTKKLTSDNPNSGEKLIAIESMVDKILSPQSALASVDRLKKLRTTLLKDENGRQAWSEIQGEFIERIKEQTFRTSNFDDIEGNPIPSYAGLKTIVEKMDKSGKLDIILTKKGAEKVRTLKDVVQYIYTAPAGTVNHSESITILSSLLDGSLLSSGVIPKLTSIAVQKIKDRKLRAKIETHLRGVD